MTPKLTRTASLAALAAVLGTGALAQDKLKVVTTFTVLADMAAQVAGDAAEVVSVTKPGAEIHGYAPTPRDIVSASDALRDSLTAGVAEGADAVAHTGDLVNFPSPAAVANAQRILDETGAASLPFLYISVRSYSAPSR